VPSLSNVATRSGTGTKSGPFSSVTRATNETMARLLAPSFHDGSGSAGAGAARAGEGEAVATAGAGAGDRESGDCAGVGGGRAAGAHADEPIHSNTPPTTRHVSTRCSPPRSTPRRMQAFFARVGRSKQALPSLAGGSRRTFVGRGPAPCGRRADARESSWVRGRDSRDPQRCKGQSCSSRVCSRLAQARTHPTRKRRKAVPRPRPQRRRPLRQGLREHRILRSRRTIPRPSKLRPGRRPRSRV